MDSKYMEGVDVEEEHGIEIAYTVDEYNTRVNLIKSESPDTLIGQPDVRKSGGERRLQP